MSDRPDQPRKPYRPLEATISIGGVPEALAILRRDLAQLLRDAADDEPHPVATRLREIAALFETGLSEDH